MGRMNQTPTIIFYYMCCPFFASTFSCSQSFFSCSGSRLVFFCVMQNAYTHIWMGRANGRKRERECVAIENNKRNIALTRDIDYISLIFHSFTLSFVFLSHQATLVWTHDAAQDTQRSRHHIKYIYMVEIHKLTHSYLRECPVLVFVYRNSAFEWWCCTDLAGAWVLADKNKEYIVLYGRLLWDGRHGPIRCYISFFHSSSSSSLGLAL